MIKKKISLQLSDSKDLDFILEESNLMDNEIKCHLFRDKNFTVDLNINYRLRYFDGLTEEFDYSLIH
jgi:hypothetical protein